jgi:hypothetical protein
MKIYLRLVFSEMPLIWKVWIWYLLIFDALAAIGALWETDSACRFSCRHITCLRRASIKRSEPGSVRCGLTSTFTAALIQLDRNRPGGP